MDREMMELYIDFAIQSLYGKVGSADIQYQIMNYDHRKSFLILNTDYK